MSRLDVIEQRLQALESGGSVAERLAALEEILGLAPAAQAAPAGANMQMCGRCGNLQNVNEFRCAQTKCPLKPA